MITSVAAVPAAEAIVRSVPGLSWPCTEEPISPSVTMCVPTASIHVPVVPCRAATQARRLHESPDDVPLQSPERESVNALTYMFRPQYVVGRVGAIEGVGDTNNWLRVAIGGIFRLCIAIVVCEQEHICT